MPARNPIKSFISTYVLWIAWRNLTRSRKSGLSVMTYFSILGVAIGVAALIVVLSVMGGFENDLRDKMLRGQPHLEVVHKTAAVGFSLKDRPLAKFKQLFPDAVDLEAYTEADVVLRQRRHLTSGVLFGVDPDRDGHLWGFGSAITEGELGAIGRTLPSAINVDVDVRRPGIVLGEELAEQLGAELGDEITVLSPQSHVGTALSGGTVSRQYVVAGKFRTQLFNYDTKWAVVSIEEGRKFMPDYDESMDGDEYVTGVAVNLKQPMAVEDVARRVFGDQYRPGVPMEEAAALGGPNAELLKDLVPLTWQTVNKSLLFALKLEKFAMGSILMLIVVVAAFSISGTMMMTVFHKRGQVSLLRSLGMNRGDIARLFLTHGFTIGTLGIAAGLVMGLSLCLLIQAFQFIELPAGVYQLKYLPVRWLWLDYLVICAAAWVFSLLAALYPSMTAARQDPGAGLRYL
jgi:lipoprotein-releasing system permease protein